ncbi:MAG: hypothetical protein ACOWYE_03850 [Desulfatiglandales bacterium]
MWWFIAILAVAVGCALYLLKRAKKEVVPQDTYICDVCGERDCICRKEEK